MRTLIRLTIVTVFATMLSISVQAQTINPSNPQGNKMDQDTAMHRKQNRNNNGRQDTLNKRNDNNRPVKPGSKNYDQKIYKDSINRSKTTPKNGSPK